MVLHETELSQNRKLIIGHKRGKGYFVDLISSLKKHKTFWFKRFMSASNKYEAIIKKNTEG